MNRNTLSSKAEIEASKGLTKQGNPRKRGLPREKYEAETKRQRNKNKHDIQPHMQNKMQ